MNKDQDPHSLHERQKDSPIDHEMGHRLDPTDNYGGSIRSRGLRRLEEAEAGRSANNDTTSLSGSDDLQDLEEKGASGWNTKVTPRQQTANPMSSGSGLRGKLKLLQKKGPAGLIAGFIVILVGLVLGFGGASIAPLMAVHNIDLDLNDPIAAASIRAGNILTKKIIGTPEEALSFGCSKVGSKLPIKCKYKTLTDKMIDRLKSVGIEVETEPSGIFGKRKKPTSYTDTYTGEKFESPQALAEAFHSNGRLRARYFEATNMRFLTLNGPSIVNHVFKRFGLTRTAPNLTGDHEERVKQLMDRAGVSDSNKLSFTEAYDPKTNERLEVDGEPAFRLDGDSSGELIKESDVVGYRDSIDVVGSVKVPPTQLSTVAMKSIDALGWVDTACSIKNMIGAAAVAQKVAGAASLAEYAMPVAALVGKMKASGTLEEAQISPEDARVLQEFFNDTDARKTIANLASDKDNPGTMPNPDYGKNAMDSEPYKMSAGGGVAHTSLADKNYSLGFDMSSLISSAASFARWIDKTTTINSISDHLGVCQIAQSGVGRVAGIAIGLFGAVVSGGGNIALQAGLQVALIGITQVVSHQLNAALAGSIISSTMSEAPVERGTAFWTGLSVIYSQASQVRGMKPGNVDDIVAYQKVQNGARQEYIAYERQKSNPLDMNNPYSLTGTVASAVYSHMPSSLTSQSLASIPTNMSSLVLGGISSLISPASAHAASVDPERFQQCKDEGLKDIGIDADVQCNVRFVMPEESMELDPMDVAQWMEDQGYVEEDTTTGFPKGYSLPEASESQNLAVAYIQGIRDSIFNTRNYGDPVEGEEKVDEDEVEEYGKFLEFCVYRVMPFGATYDDNDYAVNAPGPEWTSGEKCRSNEKKFDYFRAYVFDMSVNDDLDESPIVEAECYDSGLGGVGSAMGKASAEVINAAIERSQQNNPGNPHPLDGKGQAIIDISNKYGVNSDLIAVTLLAETQFGADGSIGPRFNNFGYNKLNEFNECEPFVVGNTGQYNCYNTPEAGIEGILKNLTGNPDYRTEIDPTAPPNTKPNTIASVRTIYCPEGDGDCNLSNFLKMGESINIPIKADDTVFAEGSAAPGGPTNPPNPRGVGSGGALTSSGAATNVSKITEEELKRAMTSYGLPEPQAEGEGGYEALAKQLKENPDALWAAQSLLAGEKNAKAKGFEVKEYLTTAWIWFESDKSFGPEPYALNCLNDTEGTEVTYTCPSASSGGFQVAGYQPADTQDKFQEVFTKLYSESELTSVMQKVVENSSKASKDIWDYNDPSQKVAPFSNYISDLGSVTLSDIWPEGGSFTDQKSQFINLILGKDPNMAAALNSFAVSDGDVVAMLKDCTSLGWSNNSYYCNPALRQEIANMMMALYLVDDGSASASGGGAQCAASAGAAAGSALPGWIITTDPNELIGYRVGAAPEPRVRFRHAMLDNKSTDFNVTQLHGPNNSQFALDERYGMYKNYDFPAYGFDAVGHPGYDIGMPLGTKLYAGVEGTVVTAGGSGYFYHTAGTKHQTGLGELKIQLSNGDEVILGHMQKIVVNVGDTVTAGTYVGESGYADGPHLHLEYRKKDDSCSSGFCIVDPTHFIP